MQFYTTLPPGVFPDWHTPEWAHSDELPFCAKSECWCHYQPVRVERYLVRPVERGDISGLQALDIYYCRHLIGAGGRK